MRRGSEKVAILLLIVYAMGFKSLLVNAGSAAGNLQTTNLLPANTEVTQLNTLNFANRSLQNLLFSYQQAGFNLVFSDSLVSNHIIIHASVPAGEPLHRLRQLLAHYNLGLLRGKGPNSGPNPQWLVVKKAPSREVTLQLQDEASGLPIGQATIIINQIAQPYLAGASIAIHADEMQQILVSAEGYQTKLLPLATLANAATVQLAPLNITRSNFIEETLITGSFHQWQKATGSHTNVHNQDIRNLPTRGNDPVQTIASLPGVVGSGVSAKPNIRGGADDELLIIFDGITLDNPYHLKDFQSLISGINSNIVEQISVYTGGYPANYGSKMSGIMDIQAITPTGEQDNTLETNPIYSALTLAGMRKNQRDYYVLASRRGNLDATLKRTNPDIGAPRFNDTFGKYHRQVTNHLGLNIGFYALRDDIKLRSFNNEEEAYTQSIYNSQYAWITAHNDYDNYNDRWQLVSSYSKSMRQGDINEPNIPAESIGTLEDQRRFQGYELSYQGNLIIPRQQRLSFGGDIKYLEATYDYSAKAIKGELATLIGTPRDVNLNVSQSPRGAQFSAFANYKSAMGDKLLLEAGLRLDGQTFTLNTHHQLSPRLAGNYQFNPQFSAYASAGRFYQAANIQDLAISDGQTDFYSPQKSDHYILGFEYAPNLAFTATAETYIKKIFNPKTRYENLFNPYALLPEIAPDRIVIEADTANAEGLEITLSYEPWDGFKSWIGYSFSEVEDAINGAHVRRSWNQISSLQFGSIYTANQYAFSAQINWHSGRPATQLPQYTQDLTTPLEYSRNAASLPDYVTLDFRLSRSWQLNTSQLEAYLDVTNATNQPNIGYYDVEITQASHPDGYHIKQRPETLFPIIPNIGMLWHF